MKNLLKGKIFWFCLVLIAIAFAGFVGWHRMERRCQIKVAGEKGYEILIITKALIQFRDGRTNDALSVLETVLDMDVAYIWEKAPNIDTTTNALLGVKRYRSLYPMYSQDLKNGGHPVLRERNERANKILENVTPSKQIRSHK